MPVFFLLEPTREMNKRNSSLSGSDPVRGGSGNPAHWSNEWPNGRAADAGGAAGGDRSANKNSDNNGFGNNGFGKSGVGHATHNDTGNDAGHDPGKDPGKDPGNDAGHDPAPENASENGPENGEPGPLWIVDSKLTPSRPNVKTVQRSRLTVLLDRALTHKLALVTAPAGFGKSTLLHDWCDLAKAKGISIAWFSPDDEDADAHQFLAYVVLALTHSGLAAPDIEVGAHNGFSDSPVRAVLRSLIAHLHASPTPRVLVLDDYHRASSPAVDEVVRVLIKEAPAGFSVIVSGRETPALDTPILLATGQAVEIGPDQLRLTKDETRVAVGDDAQQRDGDDIFDQTEGWPVAVQLAMVHRRSHPGVRMDAGASRGVLAAYLTDQVLGALDDDARDFLLTISVLERFNPDLANAVRGAEDSWRVLAKLQPLTALIIPLDVEGDWYRLHHLFAEYLRKALLERTPESVAESYRRACAWHEAKGYIVEAVKYAAMAHDYDTCARIILDAGGWRIIISQSIGRLRGLLRPLPRPVIENHWGLSLARAYLHCKDGEPAQARALFDAAVTTRDRGTDPACDPDMMTMHALIDIYDETPEWEAMSTRISQLEAVVETIDPLEAGTLKCMDVLVYFATGDLVRAEDALRRAFGYWRQSGVMIGFNYAYLHASVLALYRADFHEADANISRALELAAENFGSDSGLKHIAEVLRFALGAWRGELDRDDVEEFVRVLSYVEEFDCWCEIYFVGFDGALALALQLRDAQFVNDLAQRLKRVALQRGLDRLDVFVDALETQAAALARDNQAVLIGCQRILAYIDNVDFRATPYEWQACALSLCLPVWGESGLIPQTLAAMDDVRGHVERFGARFHGLRLDVARAALLAMAGADGVGPMTGDSRTEGAGSGGSGGGDRADEMFLDTLRDAARQGMAGPFLVGGPLRDRVRAARDVLRANTAQAITQNFCAEILKRGDGLRQLPSSGLLTPRELEILEHLAFGETNKHIARRFDLTENTVKFHLKNIFAKLDVSRRGQAIAVARGLKLID